MTFQFSPGCNCCNDSPCCCCIESITIRFKKAGVEVAAISVPLESVVAEELTVLGSPGKRCTFTTSYATTCTSGGNRLPGYAGIVPLMTRTFDRDNCILGNTLAFTEHYVGNQTWKANYVVKSITVITTCNEAGYKRIQINIDGVYELYAFASGGTYTQYNFSPCTVHEVFDVPVFDPLTFACFPYQVGRICPDPTTYTDMGNANRTQYFRYDEDPLSIEASLTGSCAELLEALSLVERWLTEYAPSISTLENCSMPLDIEDTDPDDIGCGFDCKNLPVYTWRDQADREYELVSIEPDIVLC